MGNSLYILSLEVSANVHHICLEINLSETSYVIFHLKITSLIVRLCKQISIVEW